MPGIAKPGNGLEAPLPLRWHRVWMAEESPEGCLCVCTEKSIVCSTPSPRLLGCSGDWDKEDAKEDAFLRSGWRYKERPQLPMANLTEGTTDYYLYPGHHLYHPRTGLKVDERALRNTLAEDANSRRAGISLLCSLLYPSSWMRACP